MHRKCIGCGELKTRENLIKITKEHNTGRVVINPDSLTFGRSAYLCYNQMCIESAFKKARINRALKTNASLDKSTFCKEFFDSNFNNKTAGDDKLQNVE